MVGARPRARVGYASMTRFAELTQHILGRLGSRRAFKSQSYWKERYAKGGTSGAGSYGHLAQFKAEVINAFVTDNAVESVVEFGCGDGNQLSLYELPRYTGLDVSPDIVAQCREGFADDRSKAFHLSAPDGLRADLAMSIDVLFHLTEDEVFERYMRDLFAAGTRFVIIYSSNSDRNAWLQPKHVRHRKFTDWVDANEPEWTLQEIIRNKYPLKSNDKIESPADFFIYRKSPASGSDSEAN